LILGLKPDSRLADTERRFVIAILLACILPLVGVAGYRVLERNQPEPWKETVEPEPEAPPAEQKLNTVVDMFRRNENITEALTRHGLSREQVLDLVQSARPVYNLGKVIAGREFQLNFWARTGEFNDFNYAIDDDRYLTIYRDGERFVPLLKNFQYELRTESVRGTIRDSLFLSVTEIGEQEQFAVDLSEIFAWDVDFYTEIQEGDSFRVLFEKKYLDGEFVRYGRILAAELSIQNKKFAAFRFQNEYYDSNGKALRKSFLKSPLKFTRISSRFTGARRHPILRVVRAHYGVDYAAPAGTPVVAVASGRVTAAGWDGGFGRSVRIRHDRGLESVYSHLSRIEVVRGENVAQGERVGLVGATGLATGPHLDFRILENNKYINPTKRIVPAAPPVSPAQLAGFVALRDGLRAQLDKLPGVAEDENPPASASNTGGTVAK